jgi:plasmid maintenance system killer protein
MIDRIINTDSLHHFGGFPPGWRFKSLHGRHRGKYQVRIDGQYRIRFRWDECFGAIEITVGDFHGDDD